MLIEIHQTSMLVLAVSSALWVVMTLDQEVHDAIGLYVIFGWIISGLIATALTLYRIWM